MTVLRRLAADFRVPILAISLALLAIGCGTTTPASPKASAAPASAQLSAVPGRPSGPVMGPTVGPPTTTDTEFGRIFDSLPASFPKLPGQEPAATGAGATSGSFALTMTAADASQAMAIALKSAGWAVDAGSPLEDGSIVLEATHAPAGCKLEVRFTPLSGTVIMSVLYGAACSFS